MEKTLTDRINEDFMLAMKNREADKKTLLGVVKGEIQNAKSKDGFDPDTTALAIVKKMQKSLKESAESGDTQATVELSYLDPYLPKMMDESEVRSIVSGLIESGATNIGQVMGAFSKSYAGQADNKVVSAVAKDLLSV
jgi:uncharacterized protein